MDIYNLLTLNNLIIFISIVYYIFNFYIIDSINIKNYIVLF